MRAERERGIWWWGVGALLVVAFLLPFPLSGFRLFQFAQVCVYAMVLLGLNLLTGYNGQISLGHGAFYAIGAYTTAILISDQGLHSRPRLHERHEGRLDHPIAGLVAGLAGCSSPSRPCD